MSTNVSSSISQAVAFLTRPVSFVQDAYMMFALQTILRSTLLAAFTAASSKRLVMTFTPDMPPRPIWAACIATGIEWIEWIQFFGQQEFDLIIEETSVVARYHGASAGAVTIWSAPQLNDAKRSLLAKLSVPDVARVPIRKFGQKVATGPPPNVPSRTRIVLPTVSLNLSSRRTLAQQLIASDDDSDTEELFAMISKTSIISPTPTKAQFPVSIPVPPSPISSPEPSESSRPSSRTSTLSSCFSDRGSLFSASTSTSVSLESIEPQKQASSGIYVDRSKKDRTKYLYQGGVSSTLTGGVMLGRPSKPAQAAPNCGAPRQAFSVAPKLPVQQQQPKYRAPGGARRGATQYATGANTPSWRRAPAATPVGTGSFKRF
ncbi:hypothetical protein FA13DRAFT_1305208 [Coprinellus micaceus]|uniref:Anti-proliferative protein domain-containing protein n=1 Tax=Coprinellus micaceus TaxID=71717 RepID=A0A4Y7SSD7_COPMI|nr:hypothetical protein FA13DRAFT_1305208 [Coprinellus micaceus]